LRGRGDSAGGAWFLGGRAAGEQVAGAGEQLAGDRDGRDLLPAALGDGGVGGGELRGALGGLRGLVEDPPQPRRAAKAAGKGADLDAMRAIDPDLVEGESWLLALALRQVVEGLPEGGRALVVGHSPTNEAAVLGLAGRVVPPLGKGKGVLLIEDGGDYQVELLD
jgi:hypothetical protein